MNRKALKRIPLNKLMDLKVDYAFKQLFGTERNKNITVVFLNAILQRTGRDTIKEVAFMSQELGGEYNGDKQSRLDIVVKTQDNEMINIEIQLSNQHDMIKRTMFYWSHLYTAQLQKSDGYNQLVPTITINICNFSVFPETEQYHSTYHLYEDTTMQRLRQRDDILEIHFIEMNKFLNQWYANQLNSFDDILARWLLLLGMVDARKKKVYEEIYQELEELAMKDENLLEAFNVWEDLSQSHESILAYQSRLKYIIDEEAKLSDVKFLAEKEQAISTAKVLLKNEIDLGIIMESTGLSKKEIEEVRKQLEID